MALANPNPSREDLHKFGPLAYVTEPERARIMGLPSGQSQHAIAVLEREISRRKASR